MGLLKVKGSIDISQFWPEGSSDADTTKIVIQTSGNPFQFQPAPSIPFKVTHAFDKAKVVGSVTRAPIDPKGSLTIRLQGIDAPELHYRPSPLKKKTTITAAQKESFSKLNKEYRQHLGETATIALQTYLKRAKKNPIPCTVTTAVQKPDEVFDTYGRMVGDLWISIGGRKVNINLWLAKNGWAFPTFYNSMTAEEIQSFLVAGKTGAKKKKSVSKHWQPATGDFDFSLLYRGSHASPDPMNDVGGLIMPKFFRRFCTYAIYKKIGLFNGNFSSYLKVNKEACYLTPDFLTMGLTSAMPHFTYEFVDSSGVFLKKPQDFVFTEKFSTLIGPDGKKITTW